MNPSLKVRTQVLPGHKLEIDVPALTIGQTVDVTVTPSSPVTPPRVSILEMVESLPAGQLFKTAKEIDDYIQAERDSWDR